MINQLTEDEKMAIYEEMKAKEEKEKSQEEIQRNEYKKMVIEVTEKSSRKLLRLSKLLAIIKKRVFSDYDTVIGLKQEIYGNKEQYTHSFSVENFTIKLGNRTVDSFDDTLQEGITKVKKYIAGLTKGESEEIIRVLDLLLKKDKNGNLKASRILDLKKLATDINNKDLTDGVKIIEDSYSPRKTATFIELYEKDEHGKLISVPLAISAVD